MIDDIFCKIIQGSLKEEVILEEEEWLAIKDIHPQAPVHILIIPKKHLSSLSEARDGENALLGKLLMAAERVAKKLGISEDGYRLIVNNGRDAGQLVPHLHLHLLGGKVLGPKMIK